MTTPQPQQTVEDRERERAVEYGKYVAITEINIDGARAFNVGDAVPTSHVERGVVDSAAVKTTASKAGQRAIAATTDENLKG